MGHKVPQSQYLHGLWHSFFFSTVKDGATSFPDGPHGGHTFLNCIIGQESKHPPFKKRKKNKRKMKKGAVALNN